MNIELDYDVFFDLRRAEEPPIVNYTRTDNTEHEYLIEMAVAGFLYVTEAKDYIDENENAVNNGTDFFNNKLQHCKKPLNKYDSPDLPSHDFSDKQDWDYGQYNSLFTYQVFPGKVMQPSDFLSVIDTDCVFGANQEMRVCLWQTEDGVTMPPAFHGVNAMLTTVTSTTIFEVDNISLFAVNNHVKIGDDYRLITDITGSQITINEALGSLPDTDDIITITSPTPIGDIMFNGTSVTTGWALALSNKSMDLWYWIVDSDTENPAYKVTVFKYPTLESIYQTAHEVDEIKKSLKATHDYLKKGINISFVGTERIEIYNVDHTELGSEPPLNGIGSYMYILFKSKKKW